MRREEGNVAKSGPLLPGVRAGKEVIAVGLVLLLTAIDPSFVSAQTAQDSSNRLQLSVLQGNSSTLDNTHPARLVVRVRNGRSGPVKGADVTFTTPDSGPGAVFFGGERRLTVKTDAQGVANSGPMRPDGGAGVFSVAIQAAFQNQSVTTSAQQTNKTEPSGKTLHKSGKLKWILIVGGAAAVAVAVAATKRSTTTQSTPTITAGAPSVGQP